MKIIISCSPVVSSFKYIFLVASVSITYFLIFLALSQVVCHSADFPQLFPSHTAEKNKLPMAIAILGKKNYRCPVALALLENMARIVLHDSLHWALAKPPGTALGCVAVLAYRIESELQVA